MVRYPIVSRGFPWPVRAPTERRSPAAAVPTRHSDVTPGRRPVSPAGPTPPQQSIFERNGTFSIVSGPSKRTKAG